MHAFNRLSRLLGFVSIVVFSFGTAAQADSTDPLDAFGGSPYPNLLIASGIADEMIDVHSGSILNLEVSQLPPIVIPAPVVPVQFAQPEPVDPEELEAFGGPAYPGLYVDTQVADVSPLELEESHLLLAQADEDENDPLESVNRVIFEFNEIVYAAFLTPIADTYNKVFPQTFRTAVGNVISNLASPVTLANDILQFEIDRALTTIARFLVNTTIGMGGMADIADNIGLEKHTEDFGQTLGTYGVGEGLYLVLPLLGPSNPRDAIGKHLVDPFFDPLGLWLSNSERDAARYSRIGVNALDEYAGVVDQLAQIKKTSVDYYAAIRSLYRQRRASEISNGADDALPDIPNYDLNFLPNDDGSVAIAK